MLSPLFLSVWPSQFHFLLLSRTNTGSWSVFFHSYLLDILSGQWMSSFSFLSYISKTCFLCSPFPFLTHPQTNPQDNTISDPRLMGKWSDGELWVVERGVRDESTVQQQLIGCNQVTWCRLSVNMVDSLAKVVAREFDDAVGKYKIRERGRVGTFSVFILSRVVHRRTLLVS